MSQSTFHFPGGAANLLKQIITGTGITTISLGSDPGRAISWFRVNEYAGGTPTLTVEIYDGTNRFYLGSNSFTWNAKAMTALQSLLFDEGYPLPQGSSLRITSNVANNVLVYGSYVGRQPSQAWQPTGNAAPAAPRAA